MAEKKKSGANRKAIRQQDEMSDSSQPIAETNTQGTAQSDKPEETSFPIVGIGASAGGLAAFEEFLSGMPDDRDPGMAFVLVQHLAPDHNSLLTDLIRRYTRMQVFEVENGMVVKPNCAYIIPPNRDMAFLNGSLQLMEPSAPRGQRLPIDFFFRSLAQDLRERSIGVVLSGTGSDGTQGIRSIKGEGGIVMVQTPASAEYDGMPCNAIATGLVDYELLPVEMPAQLIAHVKHTCLKPVRSVAATSVNASDAIKHILILLRTQTGHDFSLYKSSTIHRRIEKRMALHQIECIEEYVKYLQHNSAEIEALFRDLLIGVTNFFRDTEAFSVLEDQGIPKLFSSRPPGSLIRVWVPGCSTGEEAYSIAILLQEYLESRKQNYRVQIFATDIDNLAITRARTGLYPHNVAADISQERLSRFFVSEPDGSIYRIHKGIRDMLVFSEQNVIKDPPFSKLDLISCRNLLIYMGADLQKKLIPLFHYALNPGGMLFLGTSETLGQHSDLFTTLDSKSKLYQRNEVLRNMPCAVLDRFHPSAPATEIAFAQDSAAPIDPAKLSLRKLTEQTLLQQVAPASALVNRQGDIFYLHGRTGMFLEPAPGEAGINNILKMAREGVRLELATALRKVAETREVVEYPGLRVKTNGDYTTVNLAVRTVTTRPDGLLETPLYLVTLQEVASPESMNESDSVTDADSSPATDARIAELQKELRTKEEYLQATNEELETSNEELKSSNEEMQSINEELQSTNEELETSKEELQSVNEELVTVNAELQTKVADLSQANNDMNNLLAGTGIGTVFVNHQLQILRFTPAAASIINLISSDVGRPVGHIVSNMKDYDSLTGDIREVLSSLLPCERNVQTEDGKWFLMRIQPYRTLENVIEGAVITFNDITEVREAREMLGECRSLTRLSAVVRDAYDIVTMYDLEGRILAWNPAAERELGWTEEEAMQMNIRDVVADEHQEQVLAELKNLSRAKLIRPHRTQRVAKDGNRVEVLLTSSALVHDDGTMYAIVTTERRVEPEG